MVRFSNPLADTEKASLRNWVREKFGYRFEIVLEICNEIPSTGAGKYDAFIFHVP